MKSILEFWLDSPISLIPKSWLLLSWIASWTVILGCKAGNAEKQQSVSFISPIYMPYSQCPAQGSKVRLQSESFGFILLSRSLKGVPCDPKSKGARLFGAIVFHQIPSGEKGSPGDWVLWQQTISRDDATLFWNNSLREKQIISNDVIRVSKL